MVPPVPWLGAGAMGVLLLPAVPRPLHRPRGGRGRVPPCDTVHGNGRMAGRDLGSRSSQVDRGRFPVNLAGRVDCATLAWRAPSSRKGRAPRARGVRAGQATWRGAPGAGALRAELAYRGGAGRGPRRGLSGVPGKARGTTRDRQGTAAQACARAGGSTGPEEAEGAATEPIVNWRKILLARGGRGESHRRSITPPPA
jgi:hypothetical protein